VLAVTPDRIHCHLVGGLGAARNVTPPEFCVHHGADRVAVFRLLLNVNAAGQVEWESLEHKPERMFNQLWPHQWREFPVVGKAAGLYRVLDRLHHALFTDGALFAHKHQPPSLVEPADDGAGAGLNVFLIEKAAPVPLLVHVGLDHHVPGHATQQAARRRNAMP
jgi:hypothetical protein